MVSAVRCVLRCDHPGCDAAWFQLTDDHDRAIRRARIAGWTGAGATGCLCADRDVRCPDHRAPTGAVGTTL